MNSLEGRALQKRIRLPNHFPYPVVVESVGLHDSTALVRVKRPDGGLEDVTLDAAELEEALKHSERRRLPLLSGADLRHALEAVRIRLAYAFDPYFAVSLSGVRALPHQLEAVYERLLPQPRFASCSLTTPGRQDNHGRPADQGAKTPWCHRPCVDPGPLPLTPQWQDELLRSSRRRSRSSTHTSRPASLPATYGSGFRRSSHRLTMPKRDTGDNPNAPIVPFTTPCCSPRGTSSSWMRRISVRRAYGTEVKPTKRFRLIEDLSKSPRVNHLLLLTVDAASGEGGSV